MLEFLKGRSASFNTYFIAVTLAGYAALFAWSQQLDPGRWLEYGLFILLIVIADLFNVSLARGAATISVSTPVAFAAIVIFGPQAAAWIVAIGTLLVEGLVSRRPLEKLFFNVSVQALATGLAGMSYLAMPGNDALPAPIFLLPLALCGVVHFLVISSLASCAIALSERHAPMRIWRMNYLWNLRHLLAFVPLAAIIVLVYHFAAPWTLALFIIPLLLLRYAYRLYLEMKETHIATLTALTSALDAKDAYTRGHSYRVSRYALMIGRAFALPAKRLELLEYAALLHDIGKIGVSGDIISKEGTLTAEEYEEMKTHPAAGAKIIEGLNFLKEASHIVRHHHERTDGCGYPEGLKGEEIPLEARILNVCDALDAMTSTRTYRRAYGLERSLDEFRAHRGSQFDAEVVDVLLALHESGELQLIEDGRPVGILDAIAQY